MASEYMDWRKTNPDGNAQKFIAWKTGTGKTPAPGAALDPNNLPRLATGKIDSLKITNLLERQRAAERQKASDAVSRKNPPRRSFVGKQSKYFVED